MRRVTCKECGRTYNYDQDDFCPKCGGYNPPPGKGATELEAQLLSRFDSNRARQNAPTQQSTPVRTEPPRSGASRPADPYALRTPGALPRQAPHLCASPEDAPTARPRRALILALVLIAAIITVTAALPYLPSLFYSPPGGAESRHEMGEEFALGKLTVTVDGCGWLDLPENSRLIRAGYDILLVDLYAEGGDAYDTADPVGLVQLTADGSPAILPETDALLKKRFEVVGVHAVDITDARWDDPLLGQLVFYVPEGTEEAVLTLGELRPGKDGDTAALRYVTLSLPDQ